MDHRETRAAQAGRTTLGTFLLLTHVPTSAAIRGSILQGVEVPVLMSREREILQRPQPTHPYLPGAFPLIPGFFFQRPWWQERVILICSQGERERKREKRGGNQQKEDNEAH